MANLKNLMVRILCIIAAKLQFHTIFLLKRKIEIILFLYIYFSMKSLLHLLFDKRWEHTRWKNSTLEI